MALVIEPSIITFGLGNEPDDADEFLGPLASFGFGEAYETGQFNPDLCEPAAKFYFAQMNFLGNE